jgi:hypothetical protein
MTYTRLVPLWGGTGCNERASTYKGIIVVTDTEHTLGHPLTADPVFEGLGTDVRSGGHGSFLGHRGQQFAALASFRQVGLRPLKVVLSPPRRQKLKCSLE